MMVTKEFARVADANANREGLILESKEGNDNG
jgi:hypothetical protein